MRRPDRKEGGEGAGKELGFCSFLTLSTMGSSYPCNYSVDGKKKEYTRNEKQDHPSAGH